MYDKRRCGVEGESRAVVVECLVEVLCLVVDAGAEHVCAESCVFLGLWDVFQSLVDVGQSTDVFVVTVVFVGSQEIYFIVLRIFPQLVGIDGQHGLCDRIA